MSDVVHVNRVQGLTLGFGGVLGLRASRVQVRPSLGVRHVGPPGHRRAHRRGGARRYAGHARRPPPDPRLQRPAGDRAGRSTRCWPRKAARTTATTCCSQGVDRRAPAAAERPHDARAVGGRRGEPVGRRPGDAGHRELPAQSRAGLGDHGAWRASSWSGRAAGIARAAAIPGPAQPRGRRGPGRLRSARLSRAAGSRPLGGPRARLAGLPRRRDRWPAAAPELRARRPGDARRASRSGPTAAGEMALGQVEWRFEVPVPAIPLGSFASTGRSMTVAPFVAAGVRRPAAPGPALGRDRTASGRWPASRSNGSCGSSGSRPGSASATAGSGSRWT